jgi:hypothetical protein
MALTMNGTNQWPPARHLIQLGTQRSLGSPATLKARMQRIADALSETAKDVLAYGRERPEFRDTARRMVAEWETGVKASLAAG